MQNYANLQDNAAFACSEYLNLQDKVVLVTGASSGIGAATAALFGKFGSRVALGFHNNEKGAGAIRDEIRQSGGTACSIRADVQNPEAIRFLIDETVSLLGPIDILVNNAGSLIERAALMTQSVASWDSVINLNLRSIFLMSQIAGNAMVERGTGSIVNIGSIAARNGGGPGSGAYSAAKAGVITLIYRKNKNQLRRLCSLAGGSNCFCQILRQRVPNDIRGRTHRVTVLPCR
jgi:3-oxoacyl-[acyl-carrier protein] reductase